MPDKRLSKVRELYNDEDFQKSKSPISSRKYKCKYCSKIFTPKDTHKDREHPYCSGKCAVTATWESRGSFSTSCICEQCGTTYNLKQSHALKNKFCSRKCYAKRQKISLLGSNNPKWRGGIPQRACKECEVVFNTYQPKQIYCSRDCSEKNGKPMKIRCRLQFEHLLVKKLESQGWMTMRSAGSRGPIDIFAIHPANGEMKAIQVKTTSRKNLLSGGSLSTFYHASIALINVESPHVKHWLFIKVLRGPWIEILLDIAPLDRSKLRDFIREQINEKMENM